MDDSQKLKELIAERLDSLPAVVRDAITSSKVEQHLRDLANVHKLHLDQWDSLEQEVVMTLLGVHPIEHLEINIASEVGIKIDTAHALAEDINKTVFEPIRQELERQLEHPEAKQVEQTGVEAAREHLIGASAQPQSTALVVSSPTTPPPTPPPAPPITTVIRAPSSGAYKVGEPSTARKSIVDDPYREPPK